MGCGARAQALRAGRRVRAYGVIHSTGLDRHLTKPHLETRGADNITPKSLKWTRLHELGSMIHSMNTLSAPVGVGCHFFRETNLFFC